MPPTKAYNRTTVDPESGIEWFIRVVEPGEKYGLDYCLTADERMVEFYDRRWVKKFGPRGQFVSRYYAETLTEDADRLLDYGLCLDGEIPSWSVSGHVIRVALGMVWRAQRREIMSMSKGK